MGAKVLLFVEYCKKKEIEGEFLVQLFAIVQFL